MAVGYETEDILGGKEEYGKRCDRKASIAADTQRYGGVCGRALAAKVAEQAGRRNVACVFH